MDLYRFGTRTTPRLLPLRPIDMPPMHEPSGNVLPPPYTNEWENLKYPGVSLWSEPIPLNSTPWLLHANSKIPEGLVLINDRIEYFNDGTNALHWAIAPAQRMSLSDFQAELSKFEANRCPPLAKDTPNTWVRMDDNIKHPRAGVIPAPVDAPTPVKAVLRAVDTEIQRYEGLSATESDEDQRVYYDELAMTLRHWYHTYLFMGPLRPRSSTGVSFSLNTALKGIQYRPYHTSTQEVYSSVSNTLPLPDVVYEALTRFLPVLYKEGKEYKDKGDDEAVMDCDDGIVAINRSLGTRKVGSFRTTFISPPN